MWNFIPVFFGTLYLQCVSSRPQQCSNLSLIDLDAFFSLYFICVLKSNSMEFTQTYIQNYTSRTRIQNMNMRNNSVELITLEYWSNGTIALHCIPGIWNLYKTFLFNSYSFVPFIYWKNVFFPSLFISWHIVRFQYLLIGPFELPKTISTCANEHNSFSFCRFWKIAPACCQLLCSFIEVLNLYRVQKLKFICDFSNEHISSNDNRQ